MIRYNLPIRIFLAVPTSRR